MIFHLSVTGHYGDSPDNPNYHKVYDFEFDDNNDEEALVLIENFVNDWVQPQLFECYNALELAYARAQLLANILNFVTNSVLDVLNGPSYFKYSLTTDTCFVYDLRVTPADNYL